MRLSFFYCGVVTSYTIKINFFFCFKKKINQTMIYKTEIKNYNSCNDEESNLLESIPEEIELKINKTVVFIYITGLFIVLFTIHLIAIIYNNQK